MQHIRDRIREFTDRCEPGCCYRSNRIVEDVNRFLRGWAGYFRYGNSARHFDKIRNYAPDAARAVRGQTASPRPWLRDVVVSVYRSPNQLGLIPSTGIVVAPRPNRSWRGTPNAAGEGRR